MNSGANIMGVFVMRMRTYLSAAAVTCLTAAGNAQAALTAEASSALTSISGTVTDMEAGVWPIIGLATVAVISIKLFKRFSNKV